MMKSIALLLLTLTCLPASASFTCVNSTQVLDGALTVLSVTPEKDAPGLYQVSLYLKKQKMGVVSAETQDWGRKVPCMVSKTDSRIMRCFRKGKVGAGLNGPSMVSTYNIIIGVGSDGNGGSRENKLETILVNMDRPTNEEETKSESKQIRFDVRNCTANPK